MGTAAAERLPIKAYTTADGLAHLRVSCITVDSRGFLWLCGPRGLSRFDGQGFVTYGVAEGLVNIHINDFLQTTRDAYWVATNGGGVYRFTPVIRHRATGRQAGHSDDAISVSRFTAFPVGDDPQTNRVNVLYEDRRGRLWAGTDGGLFSLEGSTFGRVTLDLPSRPDRAVQIWALAEDHEGNLWMGTSWGLVRRALMVARCKSLFNRHRARITSGHCSSTANRGSGLATRPASSCTVPATTDRACRNSFAGRASHDPVARSRCQPLEVTPSSTGPEDGVAGGEVRALMQSSDGHVWVGTWDGVTQFDGERFRAYTRPQGIHRAIALAEDREGNIWSGTLAMGALRLARNGFSAYTEADGLADATIRGVFESRAGDLYAVSSNQRIHQFDGRRFTAVRPNLSEDVAVLVNPGFPLRDRTGEWWIPGGAGLYRFPSVDVRELARVRPKALHTTRDGLAGDDVFTLFEDSRGDIWIGRRMPTSSVLTRWERATGIFHR